MWGLICHLRQSPEILTEYDLIIQSQLKQGIVELLNSPAEEKNHRVHYLPHHAVIRHSATTTKIRMVYDASAKSDGPSLNDCLHTGPKFQQNILDLLIRFRLHLTALTADIKKAFLMIQIADKDRDILRFLWVRDVTKDQPELLELRFTRVVFGISSSPFLLNTTLRHHLQQIQADPAITDKLLKSLYVDDVVTGASNEAEAFQLYQESRKIFKAAGFNLRKFSTSSFKLQMQIDATDTPECNKDLQSTETYSSSILSPSLSTSKEERKVLGVLWNVQTDNLLIRLNTITSEAKNSNLQRE